MRHVILGISMAVISFLILAANVAISGRLVRQNELEQTLDAAARQAVEGLSKKEEYETEDSAQFLSEFLENFFVGIESDSDFTVSVAAANPQKGILSVRVEEDFMHINGKSGKVSSEKTVILEKYKLDKKQVFQITFKVSENIYKNYQLSEGVHLLAPGKPGESFLYWTDEQGNKMEDIAGMVADRDRMFYAVMNP